MRNFDPADWYWWADDGRLYASARQSLIDHDDADYIAWSETPALPTRWPTDDAGEQTDAALAAVLAHHGRALFPVPLKDRLTAYAADTRWRKETGGITVAGVPVATDDRSKQMIIGARVAADADADWTTQWVGAGGVVYPVDATAIVAISNAVQAHVNACFATFAGVKAEIEAGTIISAAEIDAAFAD